MTSLLNQLTYIKLTKSDINQQQQQQQNSVTNRQEKPIEIFTKISLKKKTIRKTFQ